MATTTRSEEVVVSHDSAHFNMIVCLSQKYRAKISSKDKLKARGSQLLYTFLIAMWLLQQRQPRASSCLLLVPAGTESWFPGDTPFPQVSYSLHALWKKDQEPKPRAPVCLCEQQSWKPVPKSDWCLGLRKSAQLCACLCAEQAGSHLAGASLCLPAHPSTASKGGSQLLGAVRSCLLRKLNSGFWFSPCQAGTVALLTWGNPARVEFPLLGKGVEKVRAGWHGQEPGRCQEVPK